MLALDPLRQGFAFLPDVVRHYAQEREDHAAFIEGDERLSYGELDQLMDRVAAALQRDGIGKGDVVAVCAATSVQYATAFFGIVRAAAVVAPLAPSSTPEALALQLKDCGAKIFLLDEPVANAMGGVMQQASAMRVALDGSKAGTPFAEWLEPIGAAPKRHAIEPSDPFNIIYSSGTTGAPKGIVQSHGMRWAHVQRAAYPSGAVTMLSTPLYSNTTLVSLMPTIGAGATAVLMRKFDANLFLELSQRHRATHAMLVPVQYRRLLAHPEFAQFDLSSFQMKFATSAPFPASLKAEVLRRWPGGLCEYYGMTEGGGTCCLRAHERPDKLHTVGQPLPGHDIRLIGDDGLEVEAGDVGEVVGRSASMMMGYYNQPEKTAEAEWWNSAGERFIRTGDLGCFDDEGFLTLLDRKKDLIISGEFNIYPSDLEAELIAHPAVLEAAVVGVPSERWGETPVAFVVVKSGEATAPDELKNWINGRLGRTQRLADLRVMEALPRSQIGKVLKRELRERYIART